MHQVMGDLKLAGMAIRYSQFVPKLYNYCLSLGFRRSRMMPSRAFCSDESQGYPVILLAQHFGTFPFDHGTVGGKVATDRHGPYAHHGEDLVIVQASHVGYDPERRLFGTYRRQRTEAEDFGSNCGKLAGVLEWYRREYVRAGQNVAVGAHDGAPVVVIDNDLLNPDRADGLILALDRLIAASDQSPIRVLSTQKMFAASPRLVAELSDIDWHAAPRPIGTRLAPGHFSFRRQPVSGPEGYDMLEAAIAPTMPALVTSSNPMLDAARYHTQIEFDRTYRSIQREPAYDGKNLLFVAGVNIDVSPRDEQLFPLTKFVPWAAYAQLRDGRHFVLEQAVLHAALIAQPVANPDQISFDAAIRMMEEAETIELPAV